MTRVALAGLLTLATLVTSSDQASAQADVAPVNDGTRAPTEGFLSA